MVLRLLLRRLKPELQKSWIEHKWPRRFLLTLLLLALSAFFYARYVETRWLVVRTLELGQAAAGQKALRLVVISDLHIDKNRAPFDRLAREVNALKADYVLLLGDTLNSPGGLPTLHQQLATMQARFGKFAIKGNWEDWYWSRLPLLQNTGFVWLDDTLKLHHDQNGQKLAIYGLGYRNQARGLLAEKRLAALSPDYGAFFCTTHRI